MMNAWRSLVYFVFLLLQSRQCLGFLISPPLTSSQSLTSLTLANEFSFAIGSSTELYFRDDDCYDVAAVAAGSTHSTTPPQISSYQEQRNQRAPSDNGCISMNLIHSILLNQLKLLVLATAVALFASSGGDHRFDLAALHWNGISNFFSLFDWKLLFFRFAEGVFFSIPMVMISCFIENSDHRDASQVNFSTTNMVISLFGRRRSPFDPAASASWKVMVLSTAIAVSTGISEELIFRGYIPSAIFALTHAVPVALVCQAILFACGHLSTNARPGENRLVGTLQLFNGLWYGLTYIMTEGDLLPCIIAHMLYDCHVLCETWTAINDQMDYTQKSSRAPLSQDEKQAIQQLQVHAGSLLNADTINFARRFYYAFDYDHRGCLSKKDTQRAVSYAFMNDGSKPQFGK